LFFLFVIKYKKEVNLDEFELNLLLLSPVVNQILSQLNIDLLIFFIFYFLIKFHPKRKWLNLTVFLILALLKAHPMGLLFGFLLYKHEEKYLRNFSILYTLFFIATYVYFIYIDSNFLSGQPRPSGLLSSNGLLTISQYIWINIFDYLIGFRLVIFILLVLLIGLSIVLYLKKNFFSEKIELLHLKNDIYVFSLLVWFLISSIYANYDYRNIILMLLFLFIKKSNFVTITILGLFLLSPFPSLEFQIMENILYLIKIVFYFVTICLLSHLFLNNEKNIFGNFLKKIKY